MHQQILIFAHLHSYMCGCTHVCMYAWVHVDVENKMGMQTFIGHVGNYSIMHDLLQIMRGYIFLTMIAYVIMATSYMQNMTAMRYIDTNTHTFPWRNTAYENLHAW
jgi:hypothetical protein